MPLKPENPNDLAREVAYLLDNDPIMASRIKEYINEERLCDLLCIKPQVVDEYDGALTVGQTVELIASQSTTELLRTKRVHG